MTERLKTANLFHRVRKINCQLPHEKFLEADVDGLIAGAELIERTFPSWVVMLCKVHHAEVRYISKNCKSVLHYDASVLKRFTPEEFFSLIHPEDAKDVRSCYQCMCDEISKTDYKPENYKFAFHYRVKTPNGKYVSILDEKNAYLNKNGSYLHFSLVKRKESAGASASAYMEIFTRSKSGFRLSKRIARGNIKDTITRRELEIVHLLKKGMTSKEISEVLFISVHTVRNHRTNLLRKTRCSNALELISFIETTPGNTYQ